MSYKELTATQDYADMLKGDSEPVSTNRAPDVEFDEEEIQGLNLEGEDIDHSSRQTGDWTVYLYYFRVMGWPLFSLAVGFSMFHILGATLPRKSTCLLFHYGKLTLSRRDLASMVDPR